MSLIDISIAASAFGLIVASSWDWLWAKHRCPTDRQLVSWRGVFALLFGGVAFVGAWYQVRKSDEEMLELLTAIEREGRRLDSNDFILRMEVYQHVSDIPAGTYDAPPPDRLDLFVVIGPITITGEWQLQEPVTPELSGGRNPNRMWDYYGQDLRVSGLENAQYIEDLVSQEIRIVNPVRAFREVSKSSPNKQFYVHISGREIFLRSGAADTDGRLQSVTTRVLTREDLLEPSQSANVNAP